MIITSEVESHGHSRGRPLTTQQVDVNKCVFFSLRLQIWLSMVLIELIVWCRFSNNICITRRLKMGLRGSEAWRHIDLWPWKTLAEFLDVQGTELSERLLWLYLWPPKFIQFTFVSQGVFLVAQSVLTQKGSICCECQKKINEASNVLI